MAVSLKSREWRLMIGLLCMLPGSVLADEPARHQPTPSMQQLQKVPVPADAFVRMGPAPSNVTLTPITPTSIKIEWTLSSGAVRYLISRNGAPDVVFEPSERFLHGNRFAYIDGGRKPATLHTYSVTAEYPAPTASGRSAPIQVFTSPALPPRNFKVAVSGPGAVTLNWTASPEATAYRIIRNGTSGPAMVFQATGTTYVDTNLQPGEYSYLIYSII